MRHYFTDHESLVVAMATEVGDRMERRLTRHCAPPRFGDRQAAKRHLLDVLDELVPVDEERHRESVVLLEIIAASRLNPAFAPVVRQMASTCTKCSPRRSPRWAPPTLPGKPSAWPLSGLSLNAVTPHGSVEPATIRAVLEAHVAEL
ncbi:MULTISPECIES: TetR family transcriptional regulator C-terminal domain-containing protein [Nocardia]|uniref:TetR family transcriptional regulator C-terminal domain-containing protein n=1 Tax=Nocardia TaxID=1817 RepID=UPI001F11630D|nr:MULTISPECIES: TetR family transcriptional regulator C-terminal domain-containing protein [Nocardia]